MELKYLNDEDVVTHWGALNQLLHSCIEVSFLYPVTEDFFEKKLARLRTYLKQGQAYVLGALEDGKLLGFYWMYELEGVERRKLHVAYGAILPEARGRGIFNLMDKEAERKARELGISVIELMVSTHNPAVIQIHEKSHGYSVAHVVMEKEITL